MSQPDYKKLFDDFDHLWTHVARTVAASGGPEFRHADTFDTNDRKADMTPVLAFVRDRLAECRKAEDAYQSPTVKQAAPVYVSTREEAEAYMGKGNDFVAMAANKGAFNVPGIAVHMFSKPEEPIDPDELAGAERLVREGYEFCERGENRIHNPRDPSAKLYMLTSEQSRVFYTAFVKVRREERDGEP